MTIGDHVPIVASLLGGRTDINDKVSNWIAYAYRDLTSSIPFEELELTDTPIAIANIPTVDYPTDARAIKSLTINIASNTFAPLYKRNMAIIDRYTTAPGTPSVWAPFNNQIHLRQIPVQNYPLVVRYWQRVVLSNPVNDTQILIGDDWQEILDYAAQLRGYIDLQELDKASAVRTLLYGDPRNIKRNPGLIKVRMTRIQAEYENANYGLRPRIRRYTYVR